MRSRNGDQQNANRGGRSSEPSDLRRFGRDHRGLGVFLDLALRLQRGYLEGGRIRRAIYARIRRYAYKLLVYSCLILLAEGQAYAIACLV